MNTTSDPLHHAPDQSDTVLLLIDVINHLEFEGGDKLFVHALPMAERLAVLKRRCKERGIPVIYANDNFGRWRSDFPKLVKSCLQPGIRGAPIVQLLIPDANDYFILKPKHSAFFQTNLDILLKYLNATRIILAGMAGDICVLFSANDAYMRDFRLLIPSDCVVSEDITQNALVLNLMQRVLKADISPSGQIQLDT